MIQIVPAREEHLPGIIERWAEFLDYHAALDPLYTRTPDGHVSYREHVLKMIMEPTACVLVALDGDTVAGYATARITDYPPQWARRQFGYISGVAVANAYRRQGIGADLTKGILDWLSELGVDRAELRVSSCNDVALSFWESQGFRTHMNVMYRELGGK